MQEATRQHIELNDVDHAGTVFNIHGHLITYELLCDVVEAMEKDYNILNKIRKK